ncbi:MAG: AmmeMemoRadiSam system protein B [Betaproteobacteria bacterium]|nr:AmmeMemoRadiSam system protein B [Betaproteobacteria bacterium]
MNSIRPTAVAGAFYPGDTKILAASVKSLLADVAGDAQSDRPPKAIIAPHAGYIYSGPIAASIYARLAPLRGRIRRVVLIGPAHRVWLRGIALPDAVAFASPLGDVEIDADAVRAITSLPQVTVREDAHAQEHSLEVQLPFLQSVLGDFRLVPLVVGQATPGEVAEVLDALWGGEETLIVVSSDLSHFLDYRSARSVDGETARAINALDSDLTHEQACGATAINGLTNLARRRGMEVEQIDLRNSGDTAGDRSRVVGYGAFAFREKAATSEKTESEAGHA